MATTTPNYGLTKPAGTDPVDISVLNTNADIIDTALHGLDTSKQDAEEGMGLSQESYTTAEKSALALINAAFPMMLRRGAATMNSDSGFGFDDIHETIYYRYTASAIGNPVSSAYGIILTFAFTSYIVQVLFSNKSSTSCELRYRFSADTGTTWRPWHLVTATAQS